MKKLFKFIHTMLFVNTIALAVEYLAMIDEIYQREALTMEMEAPSWLKRAGSTAKTILLPKVTTEGLRNYSRATGYQTGDNTFEWEEHTYAIDRGTQFEVDRADDMETINTAFDYFTMQFMRNDVVPEVDAYRFATLAGRAAGVASVEVDLSKDTALQAWDDAMEYIENTKVPKMGLLCYMSPTFKKFIKQSNLIERQFYVQMGQMMINREVDSLGGMPIKNIPQDRFFTAITLQDGANAGYIKNAASGRDINFMIVDSNAALADKKIDALKIFDPDTNQDKDAWKFQYRLYHDIFTPDNKIPGIYVNHKTT